MQHATHQCNVHTDTTPMCAMLLADALAAKARQLVHIQEARLCEVRLIVCQGANAHA